MVHVATNRICRFVVLLSISWIETGSSFTHPASITRRHISSAKKLSKKSNSFLWDRHHVTVPILVQSNGSSSGNSVIVENEVDDGGDDDRNNIKNEIPEQQGPQLLVQLQKFQFSQKHPQPQLLVPEQSNKNGVDETDVYINKEVQEKNETVSENSLLWKGVVALLCAVWASNFACAKIVLAQPGVDASLFAVARFSLAAVSLLPGAMNAARRGMISWKTARGAFVCGSWVAFGYLGQTVGLMTTTPSRACVICSLNCIFVAIVAELSRVNSTKDRGYKTNFDLRKLIPALIAVAGVAIIELKGAAGNPTIGDLICFSQPIGFGLGYLQLEELMKKEPNAALPVSGIKLAVVAMAALVLFELSPHSATDMAASSIVGTSTAARVKEATLSLWKVPDFAPIFSSPVALGAICYMGIVTTSLALWVESIAFQRVQATDASIILTTEPLFAATISSVLVGEQFGVSDAIGAFFIVGACIYAVKMGQSNEICDEVEKECVVVGDISLNS